MNKISSAISILLLFAACNQPGRHTTPVNNDNHDKVTGGPCTYDEMPFKATIISIAKDTSQTYPAYYSDKDYIYKVKVTTNVRYHDTLELSRMTHQDITQRFLDEHHLAVGTVLEGTAELITSGTCTPESYRFKDSSLNAY